MNAHIYKASCLVPKQICNGVGNRSEIVKKRSSSKVDYDKSNTTTAMRATRQTIAIA